MLQLIIGRPSSGKTYTLFEKIGEQIGKGRKAVLMVPEQFTFESERAVLHQFGDKKARLVTVLSFSRLFDEVGRMYGGTGVRILSDCEKVIFMNRTLKALGDDLVLWKKYRNSVPFARTVLDAVGEMKINALSPEDLRVAAEQVESTLLKNKLTELALVYETYDALVGERYLDPADKLSRIGDMLEKNSYFADSAVFFDCFKGFTGQQFKIIKRIFMQTPDCFFALTDDPGTRGEYCVYANIRKLTEKIRAIAAGTGVKESPPILLEKSRHSSQVIAGLERMLSGNEIPPVTDSSVITLCLAETEYDEAEYAACTIHRLVREKGYRFRDFVIISRNSDQYRSAVAAACKRNQVNCFYDSKIPLSAFPLSAAARAAVSAVSLSGESILAFHKTGLGTLSPEEAVRLENYVFIWKISGKKWLTEWDMDPRGLVSQEESNDSVAAELEEINRIRLKAVEPLIRFRDCFSGSAKDMAAALVNLLEECHSGKKLKEICNSLQDADDRFYADAVKLSYEAFMGVLDSLAVCFGEETLSKKEFSDALELALAGEEIGVIPQTLDEVIFGSADRIRPSSPKVAFILGANQGEFPQSVSNDGLFALTERKSLIEKGLEVADHSVSAAIDEDYLVYCNLTCPSERLFVIRKDHSLLGDKAEPSAFVKEIAEHLPVETIAYPDYSDGEKTVPETVDAAFGEYCRIVRTQPGKAAGIKAALREKDFPQAAFAVLGQTAKKQAALSPDTARKLFGSEIQMSPTKFETFHKCRFSFFCRYGLGARKIQPADFDAMQRGTIVHYVIEQFMSEYGKDIIGLDPDSIARKTEEYIRKYLGFVKGFENAKTPKTEFLLSRICRSVAEVVLSISREMAQCDFEPVAFELKIGGKNPDIPAVRFSFEEGTVVLGGSIDRVDAFGDYVRIIDYKTGSKSFKLPDITKGLNMQMLLYLYCVIRGCGKKDSQAAGILYKPAKRDVTDKGYAMNGLLQGNIELVAAMDKNLDGTYVPRLTVNKDGSLSKASQSFIDADDFSVIFDYTEQRIKLAGREILGGDMAVSPVNGRESSACKYCDFAAVCGIEDESGEQTEAMKKSQVIDVIREECDRGQQLD